MLIALLLLCIVSLVLLLVMKQREKAVSARLSKYVDNVGDGSQSSSDLTADLLKSTASRYDELVALLLPRWSLLTLSIQRKVRRYWLLSIVVAITFFYAWLSQWALAIILGSVSSSFIVVAMTRWHLNKQLAQFEEGFPNAIGTLARCLSAGIALPSAIEQVHQRSAGFILQVFSQLSKQLAIGVSLDDALALVSTELNHHDFSLFAVTLRLNQRAGGQLVDILNQLANDMTVKRMQTKKLLAQTAGVRSSAKIIAAMVPILLAVFYFSAPHIFTYFKDDQSGQYIGIYAVVSIVLGLIIVRQMTRLER